MRGEQCINLTPQIATRAVDLLHFGTEQLFVKFIDQLAKRFARHRDAYTLKQVDVATAIEAFTAFRHIRGIPAHIANNLSSPPRQRNNNAANVGQQNQNTAATNNAANDERSSDHQSDDASKSISISGILDDDGAPDESLQGTSLAQTSLPSTPPVTPVRQPATSVSPPVTSVSQPATSVSPPITPAGPSRPQRARRPPVWLTDYETKLDLRTLPINLRVQRISHDRNNLVAAVVRAYNAQTNAIGSDRLTAKVCHDIFDEEGLDATEKNTREQLHLLASRLKVSIAVHDQEFESIILYGKSRRRIFIRRTLHYDAYIPV